MEGRETLNPGTILRFANHEGGSVSYVVRKEIGRGGSCIVYDASYTDNLGNDKPVRIKECYPHVFGVVKNLFRCRKTRYRGKAKVDSQLKMVFALANLFLADTRYGLQA